MHVLYITQQHEVTSSELKENLENAPSERTLQIELSRLKEMGILELSGYGRGAKWMIKKKAQKGAERRRKAQKDGERWRRGRVGVFSFLCQSFVF